MITFNPSLFTIELSLGTLSLDVKDLYSRWKDWVMIGDNSKYPPALQAVGGDPIDLTAGTYVPAYVYLMNGWTIVPQAANHTLNVSGGVLLREGGGDPFASVSGFTVRVNYSQPVQAITVATGGGGGTVDVAQIWAFLLSNANVPGSVGNALNQAMLNAAAAAVASQSSLTQSTQANQNSQLAAEQARIAAVASQT